MTGNELLELRVANGLRQSDIASVSDVSAAYISLLENDERVQEYRARIAAAIRSIGPKQPVKKGRPRRSVKVAA